MSEIRAVFFDIDGTLFSTSEFASRAREASVDAMVGAGLPVSREELLEELAEVVLEFSSNYEKHFDKLLLRLPRRTLKGLNPAVITAAGIVAYHDTKTRLLEPFVDAVEVLRRLRQTELLLGIITEGLEIKQAEKLVRLRLLEFFQQKSIFISHQVGISKPNPKLYQRACIDLNLRPSECVYVGDNPLMDIDPANEIGMITVLVQREDRFRNIVGQSPPDHIIQNFWDLAEVLRECGVEVPEVL
ncbi:MAG: TIGR02253 family HAD-type hydrolase [Planctomycetes bacterium]|jgi:putative hydrolase of the HAD superfamily|nr:TIGR02253 family HAD-type hydrolase [Planctomycetota bacterium]MBT6453131.1 TIGR02253 family HAD-type hydrolase [Planctomycetota bacterium]MBT6541352.1 TIGR02253 family HAD-type hydrolase [Planctomycetota bacterium]MBT6784901.1 TIGR02253 family HAD-type hydrolase [Planctomycetota bacterium]MBT6967610.1 TIGR02253 family HAD-type hydrolase [Planctomycetota bacterium]